MLSKGNEKQHAAFSAAVTGSEPLARTAAVATAGATTDMFFHATLARTFISALSVRGDDDIVDRLNYYYTPIMLAIACLVVSAKQFGGSPIECWVNPHSRESMEEYIEAFCWIQNTYWVPMYEHIPDSHERREEQQIGYYQWVPFILIAQALMFSMPCILWRILNWQNGTNIQHLISAAGEARTILDPNERERVLQAIAGTFVEMIDLREIESRPHPSASFLARLRPSRLLNGHLVCSLYLFVKLCYTLNIMLQFTLLNTALKSDEYFLYGFQVLTDLFAGKEWSKSGHFPRVTLCDFEVRYLANLNRYTVQCALLINIINEKVFAFFWLWYCVLLCATTCSALFWLTNSLLHAAKSDYVLKFMQIAEHNERMASGHNRRRRSSDDAGLLMDLGIGGTKGFRVPSTHALDKFVEQYLKSDGLFVLRLVANNAGELVVVSIVKHLWREFAARQYLIRPYLFDNPAMMNSSCSSHWGEAPPPHQQQQQLHPTFLPMNSTRLGNGPTSQTMASNNIHASHSQTNLFGGAQKAGGIHLILDKRKLRNNNSGSNNNASRRSTEADIYATDNLLSPSMNREPESAIMDDNESKRSF